MHVCVNIVGVMCVHVFVRACMCVHYVISSPIRFFFSDVCKRLKLHSLLFNSPFFLLAGRPIIVRSHHKSCTRLLTDISFVVCKGQWQQSTCITIINLFTVIFKNAILWSHAFLCPYLWHGVFVNVIIIIIFKYRTKSERKWNCSYAWQCCLKGLYSNIIIMIMLAIY